MVKIGENAFTNNLVRIPPKECSYMILNGSDDNKMLKQERYETSGAAQLEKLDTYTFQLLYIVRKIKCKIARKLLLKPGMAPNSRDGDATKGIRFEDLSDKIPSLG